MAPPIPGCPHVEAARKVLREGLGNVTEPVRFEEIDVTVPNTPDQLRGWGSPTILIDGRDVAGGKPTGTSCRLYAASDTPGTPSLTAVREALSSAR
jgi:mercuric ion transport protein